MTNTKQLTGAAALLALIAVLDIFIFVELDPDFESMVLVDADGSPGEPAPPQTTENTQRQNGEKDFWIDQQQVSTAEFSKFLETTGHQPQEVMLLSTSIVSNTDGDFVRVAGDDRWRTQSEHGDWNKPGVRNEHGMHQIFEGQDGLKVSFNDALAYCIWLGKDLPSAEQLEFVAAKAQGDKDSSLFEFRCAKNI